MVIELVSFFIVLLLPVGIVYQIVHSGLLGILLERFSVSVLESNDCKWTPLMIEQKSKPTSLFIGVSRIGSYRENGICIGFVFPLNIVLKNIAIPREFLRFGGIQRKHFRKCIRLNIVGIDEGYLLIPYFKRKDLYHLFAENDGESRAV